MIIAAFLLTASLVLLIWCLGRFFGPGGALEMKKNLSKRLSMDPVSNLSAKDEIVKKYHFSDISFFSDFLKRHNAFEKIASRLKTAKWRLSVSVLLLGSTVLGVVLFLFLKNKVDPTLAAASAVLAFLAPLFFLAAVHQRYLVKFGTYLPDALGIVSNSIKAGHGLEMAMNVAAKNAVYPVGDEFKTVEAEVRLGMSLQTALGNLYKRIGSPELKIFITGIAVHQELGGNLSENLDNLQKTIRERFELLREIETLSAQGIVSAWVLFCLPFVLGFFQFSGNPKSFSGFMNSGVGHIAMMACVVLQVSSFLWIRQIIRIKD